MSIFFSLFLLRIIVTEKTIKQIHNQIIQNTYLSEGKTQQMLNIFKHFCFNFHLLNKKFYICVTIKQFLDLKYKLHG